MLYLQLRQVLQDGEVVLLYPQRILVRLDGLVIVAVRLVQQPAQRI